MDVEEVLVALNEDVVLAQVSSFDLFLSHTPQLISTNNATKFHLDV